MARKQVCNEYNCLGVTIGNRFSTNRDTKKNAKTERNVIEEMRQGGISNHQNEDKRNEEDHGQVG